MSGAPLSCVVSSIHKNLHKASPRIDSAMDTEWIYTEDDFNACTSFIRASYEQHLTDNIEGEQDRPIYLDACLFHTALVRSSSFISEIQRHLSQEEMVFALTALINYKACVNSKKIGTKVHTEEPFNGTVIPTEFEDDEAQTEHIKQYQLVAGLVAYGGDANLFSHLCQNGINLMQKDDQGNTILHILADLSEEYNEKAIKFYEIVMKILEKEETQKQLLLERNNDGETVLDFVSKRCLPEMLHAVLNTKNVYKFCVLERGCLSHYWYDITDSENRKHRGKTLLHYLSTMTESQIIRADDFQFLQKEPFHSLIKHLHLKWRTYTLVWMVTWAVTIVFFLTAMVTILNNPSASSSWFLDIIIVSGSSLGLVTEGLTSGASWPYFKLIIRRIIQGKAPVSFVIWYRLLQVYFLITVTTTHALHLLGIKSCSRHFGTYMYQYLYVGNVINGIVSMMFFTQLNDSMGHYLIIIERMISALLSFVILSAFYTAAFSITFYVLQVVNNLCPNNLTSNSAVNEMNFSFLEQNSDHSLNSVPSSIYSTILYELGISAPEDFYFTQTGSSVLSIITYLACIVYVTLVLLNLVIAVMNQLVVKLCDHRRSLVTIAQVGINLIVEDRVSYVYEKLDIQLPTSKYIVKCADERIYLHTVEPVPCPS